MGFSVKQVRALKRNPDHRHIRTRLANGRELTYLEGWYAITEANRIFGFDGWSRETIESKCILAREKGGTFLAVYVARVRLTVQANGSTVIREGHGTGEGRGTSPGEVHDIALKAAETDATKRALATFGRPFGLELYRGGKATAQQKPLPSSPSIAANEADETGLVPDHQLAPDHQDQTVARHLPMQRLPMWRPLPVPVPASTRMTRRRSRDRRTTMAAGIKTRLLGTSGTSDSKPSGRLDRPRERPCLRLHRLRLALSPSSPPAVSTRAFSPSPSPNGCATRRIWGLWPHSPASSAAGSHPTRIICAFPNPEPSVSKSATSSPFRSAAVITGNCIRPATK